MKSLFKFILFVLVLALALAGLYKINAGRTPSITPVTAVPAKGFTPVESAPLDLKDLELLSRLDQEYTRLIKAVTPSVVSITTSRMVRGQIMDPFEMFYGRQGRTFEQKQNSLGSGAIVSKEGHIITNNHVIDGMDQVSVLLNDGRRFDARLIGTDPETDIAVLKIDAENLIPLPFGDSDAVQVGQMVFAVGNPFGLEESVTQGIISAIGRRTMSDSGNEFLQTDTAINPGNSGGPLINLKGEIVGVNNHIFSQSGGYQGIAFAIPSNVAHRTLESVVKTGRVVRGYLGIVMQPLSLELAQHFGLSDSKGILVAEVLDASPAAMAGIRPGDIIRKFNGSEILDLLELRTRVGQLDPGQLIAIEVIRAGKPVTLNAKILEMPGTGGLVQSSPGSAPGLAPIQPQAGRADNNPLRGVTVRPLTPAIAQQFNLPSNVQGVQVVEVQENVPAFQVLQPGDVIEEIDRRTVTSAEDYEKIAKEVENTKRLLLFICRERTRSFVMIVP